MEKDFPLRKVVVLVFTILFILCNHKPTYAASTGSFVATEAVKDSLPVPKGIKNLLFYVQRDPNANTVVYELNVSDKGILDENEPVKAYWIRYTEKGVRRDLSYIQRKFAYGLDVKKLAPEKYELHFVSYGKLPLYLQKGPDGKYHVYTQINQKQSILNRAFVRIQGGTFWVPNVQYVELFGIEASTGKEISKRFKP